MSKKSINIILEESNKKILEGYKQRYENFKFYAREPILDIGGGDGSFLESQGIKEATIIDLNVPKEPKFNHKYIKVDITKKLPIKKGYKTIFLTEVLEHIKNPLYLMAQVYDLLEDDGICYISVPYTEIWPTHHHVCRWKLKEITNQVNKLGFEYKVIQTRRRWKGIGFFYPHCWIVLALRKRRDNFGGDGIKAREKGII